MHLPLQHHVPGRVVRGTPFSFLVGEALQWTHRYRAWWKVILADGREVNEWDGRYSSTDSPEYRQLLAHRLDHVNQQLAKLSIYNPAEQGMMMQLLGERAHIEKSTKSIGLADWSLLPFDKIRTAMLIAPNGDFAVFNASEGGLFFQFKIAYAGIGISTETGAHVLGKVYTPAGDAEMAVFDHTGLSDIMSGNVWELTVHGSAIGELCGFSTGLTRVDNQLTGKGH